jgi:hypothetical protein
MRTALQKFRDAALARCDPGIRGLGGADEGAAATGAVRKGCDRNGAELSIDGKDSRRRFDDWRLGLVGDQLAQERTNLAVDARDYSWPAADATTLLDRKCL